jgi:hypothetical protein
MANREPGLHWTADSLGFMLPGTVYADVAGERLRAHRKHGPNGMESRDAYDRKWWTVLMEEVGEVARAFEDGESIERIKEELVQVTAMAAAWVDACDRSKG